MTEYDEMMAEFPDECQQNGADYGDAKSVTGW
jgi:hypothetical protein